MTMEEEIHKIHDFVIRMEPIIADVKEIKKWKTGNSGIFPGAQVQLWLLWIAFCASISAFWYKLTHG